MTGFFLSCGNSIEIRYESRGTSGILANLAHGAGRSDFAQYYTFNLNHEKYQADNFFLERQKM